MIKKTGNWLGWANMLQKAGDHTAKTLDKAVHREAIKLAGEIKKNITSGGQFAGQPFAPNAPSTIARKGSSKPLIDTSDMRNSVTAKKLEPMKYLVGIPGDAVGGENHTTIAEYARLHEFGGVNEHGVMIVPRPFIGPTVEKTREEHLKKVREEMLKLFNIKE